MSWSLIEFALLCDTCPNELLADSAKQLTELMIEQRWIQVDRGTPGGDKANEYEGSQIVHHCFQCRRLGGPAYNGYI